MNIHKTHCNTGIVTFLCAFFLFSLCTGCTPKNAAVQKNDTLTITATFYPLYIMLLNITDNIPGVRADIMAPVTSGCLHNYQLTSADMKKLENTDIIVCNGAGSEHFMEKIISSKQNVITASASSDLLPENGSHHEDGAYNPHIWVSVKGAIDEVNTIAAGLKKLDPAHGSQYAKNAQIYCEKLEQLHTEMQTALSPFRGREIITFHEAFPYFARDFGLTIAAVIEQEADSEPSAKEILEIISLIKERHITALFAEPQYAATSADIISRETGVPVSILDPCVTGSFDKDAYIAAMNKNRETLVNVLRRR